MAKSTKCALCNMAGADDSKDGIPVDKECWRKSVSEIGSEKTVEKMRENLAVAKILEK